ncbi:NADP-dependent oxidoreductase domain-containing protein [Mycena leptocephala]|nr:NADP-dependent oxidoreductase domain-containing protein [Mycena leptocephala]
MMAYQQFIILRGGPCGQQHVDIFLKTGGKTIDTTRVYGNGTSEEFLALRDVKGAHIDAKYRLSLVAERLLISYAHRIYPAQPGAPAPDNLRRTVKESVEALGPHKINVLYLHSPDRSVPFVDVAREINELHKEGLLREFGLSNYHSWEVAEFYFIAEKNEWIQPTVYQTCWSVKERPSALFPILKKFGIRFHGYSPLAGSILAGKDLGWATSSGSIYFIGKYSPRFPPAQELRDGVVEYGLSLPEVAFRWLHSIEQLNKNIAWSEEGPPPAGVVKLVDGLFARHEGPLHHYDV